MIDPITAFATASAAVEGIKKGIKLGRDIGDLTKQVMAFFDAKDVVVKASIEDRNRAGKSTDAQALENVMHAKAVADMERELNRIFVLTNNAELWQQLQQERNRLKREEREAKERVARERKRVAAKRVQMAEYAVLGVVAVLITIGAIVMLTKVLIWYVNR